MSTLSGSGFGGGGGILAAAAAAARRPKQPHQQQTRALFIQTQTTPNPQSLMFVPGQPVLAPAGGGGGGESGSSGGGGSPVEFSSARAAAAASPLARRLFAVDGVSAVFFGSDFITVTKAEDASWATLKPDLFAAISDHYASGEPTLSPASAESEAAAAAAASGTAPHPDDDEVVAMIKELLETRIRPAVREDGGDIVFRSWDAATGTVSLRMAGACSGCPSSAVTLKSGIENMLMHYVPEVKEVVEVSVLMMGFRLWLWDVLLLPFRRFERPTAPPPFFFLPLLLLPQTDARRSRTRARTRRCAPSPSSTPSSREEGRRDRCGDKKKGGAALLSSPPVLNRCSVSVSVCFIVRRSPAHPLARTLLNLYNKNPQELPDDLLEQLKEPEDPEAAKKKLVESMLSN